MQGEISALAILTQKHTAKTVAENTSSKPD